MQFTKKTYKALIRKYRKTLRKAINDPSTVGQEAREVLSLKLTKIIARAKREGVDAS